MAYIREHWEDSPSTATSINARRLNHIEGGIEDNDQRITVLEANPIGHVVLDKLGTASTQRDRIQFTGVAEVSDNAPSNKTIVNIPSSLSAYTNDAGFIDSTVNNLVNYYKKTETYTQAEVNALISAIVTLNILVVQTLPTQDISTTTIYLVPKATAETQDIYDEYLYINNAWEHIGSTQVDLTNYYTKTETDALLADKVDKVAGKQLSTEDFTSALKSKLEGIASGAEVNVQPDWSQTDNTQDDYIKNKPTKVSDFTNDSGFITGVNVDDIGDVLLSNLADGQVLKYNSTSQKWENSNESGGGGGSYTAGDGIDITNNEISVDTTFTEASTRANIASGDTLSTIWGKIKKFFSDLKNHAFTALDQNSIDIGGMAGGQQYVYVKGVNDFSYNNGIIQISKRTGYSSYDTELIPIPTDDDYVAKSGDTTQSMSTNLIINRANGTSSANGSSVIQIGNNIPSGTAGNSRGYVELYGTTAYFARLRAGALSAQRNIDFPDKSGTLMLTSDDDVSVVVNSGGVLVTRSRHTVCWSIEKTPSSIAHGTVLATGFPAPLATIYTSVQMNNGQSLPVIIETNGKMSVYYPSSQTLGRIDASGSYHTNN